MNPGPNMVGLDSFADRENPQRKGVEECPAGAVFVIDSRQDSTAASAGCILATRLQMRGCNGIVTDGGFRDTPEISALDMPTYHTHASAPTNLTKHHAVANNDPIACGGVSVFAGDIMVGDNEGVVCIPLHLVTEIAIETEEMTIFEDFVLEMVQDGASIFGLYPPTDPKTKDNFKAWREKNNR